MFIIAFTVVLRKLYDITIDLKSDAVRLLRSSAFFTQRWLIVVKRRFGTAA